MHPRLPTLSSFSFAIVILIRSLANLNNNEAVAVLITSNGSSGSRQKCNNIANDGLKLEWQEIYAWNGSGSWLFYLMSIFLLCDTCQAHSNQCAVGLIARGRTWPDGDIFLKYGRSLTIYCMLNENLTEPLIRGKNSSDLVFIRNEKEIKSEHITVINETTIMMHIEKPAPSKDTYFCKVRLNDSPNAQYLPVCMNKVAVGFKPLEPTKFDCVSKNWENLTCTWEPAPNNIPTHFSLHLKLLGPSGVALLRTCPITMPEVNLPPNTCFWDSTTNPMYKVVYEYYTFKLHAKNALGGATFSYRFHHFAHVIPSKPTDVSWVDKTHSSILLHWKIPYPMKNFPPGLHHRISYRNQWDRMQTWEIRNITANRHDREKYVNLTDLQYANTVYDLRISMKSAVAIGEDKWGQPSDITIKTAATLPGLPPRTDIGSFEIARSSSQRDVYIYWQTIPPHLENGDNFTYKIVRVEEGGKTTNLQPNEITEAYAKFGGLGFNISYKFEISSTNCEGASKHQAIVYVPKQSEMPREPVAFTKIAFHDGLYELSWDQPIDSNIKNYTIFWCESDRDRPYQCSGYLDWVHVSGKKSVYNMTVPKPTKVYQFAIAANAEGASSGMVWTSCAAIHNQFVSKIKSVWINRIESDSMKVGWRLDCSNRIGTIEAFIIYYCPILSPFDSTCKSQKMNMTAKAYLNTIGDVIRGLKPYTTYMVTVTVLTKNGESLHSDPIYETTLEAAPTPPKDVVVTNVTNTTMLVEWQAPAAMNGILKHYLVYYDENWTNVEESTSAVIDNLDPGKVYKITVAACTVRCSKPSALILQATDIGVPGQIEKPLVRFTSLSQVHVMWKPPNKPGGFLDYYEVLTDNDDIYTNITSNEIFLTIPDCGTAGREDLNRFRVRAINLGHNESRFVGPWSEPGEVYCYSNGIKGQEDNKMLFVVIFSILTINLIGLVVGWFVLRKYRIKRARRKFKAAILNRFDGGAMNNVQLNMSMAAQAEVLPFDKKWEYPRKFLKFDKVLGSGAFGIVRKAEAKSICRGKKVTTVAVKMVRATHRLHYMTALIRELKVLVHLGSHLNVVNLLGACTTNISYGELLVIVEFCRFGNLRDYLLHRRADFIDQIDHVEDEVIGLNLETDCVDTGHDRDDADTENSNRSIEIMMKNANADDGDLINGLVQPSLRCDYRSDDPDLIVESICTKDLLCWAWQVTRGMRYLGLRKVVHGDLAARNVLLAENNVIKICDFGLAEILYKDEDYTKLAQDLLPLQWMAIESLKCRVFSTQSDIWSFGILLWEFFTLAEIPYRGINPRNLYEHLSSGYRLKRPKYAPEKIYNMMMKCWDVTPEQRPTFARIEDDLGKELDNGIHTYYSDMSPSYTEISDNEPVETAKPDYLLMDPSQFKTVSFSTGMERVSFGDALLDECRDSAGPSTSHNDVNIVSGSAEV